jgi:hypothetical protein
VDGMAEEGAEVPVGELIRVLRAELEGAVAAGEGHDLVFGLGPIELELAVGVMREGKGEAGVKLWALTLGGSRSVAAEQTQRIKLMLAPRRRDDPQGDVYVSRLGMLGD